MNFYSALYLILILLIKLENLEYIAKCLNLQMDEIDISQECYLNEDVNSLFLDSSEFDRYIVPTWLTLEKAKEIFAELKVSI